MTFYVNYITYLLVTLMSSVVRYSGHYNLILRTIQYYIPKLLFSLDINNPVPVDKSNYLSEKIEKKENTNFTLNEASLHIK